MGNALLGSANVCFVLVFEFWMLVVCCFVFAAGFVCVCCLLGCCVLLLIVGFACCLFVACGLFCLFSAVLVVWFWLLDDLITLVIGLMCSVVLVGVLCG